MNAALDEQRLERHSLWRLRATEALALGAAGLLGVVCCARVLTEIGEAIQASGPFPSPDAAFDVGGVYKGLSEAYRTWYMIGLASAGLLSVAFLSWFHSLRRVQLVKPARRGASGLTPIVHLGWITVVFGTAISVVGYQMAAEAAQTWSEEKRIAALDSITTGALVDLGGTLAVLLGAVYCVVVVRGRSRRLIADSYALGRLTSDSARAGVS